MSTLPVITGEYGVVKEPEIRFSENGRAWAKIRGSFKDRVRDSMGNWTDGERMFIDIIVSQGAENLIESIRVGDSVIVTGRLQIRKWSDNDGNDRYNTEIKADSIGVSLRWGPAKTTRALEESLTVDAVKDALGATEETPF